MYKFKWTKNDLKYIKSVALKICNNNMWNSVYLWKGFTFLYCDFYKMFSETIKDAVILYSKVQFYLTWVDFVS